MKMVFVGLATMGLMFGGDALAADLPVKGSVKLGLSFRFMGSPLDTALLVTKY